MVNIYSSITTPEDTHEPLEIAAPCFDVNWCYEMFHRMRASFTSSREWRYGFAIAANALALLATPACIRSNVSPTGSYSAAAQSSEKPHIRPANRPAQPPTSAPSELDELQQKAQAGDSNAMYRLGRLYATGSGVAKDYVEAFDWYRRAAAKGNAEAMYSLGEAYEHGTGVRDDIQRAVNWYHEAAARGNRPAKAALARLGESIEDHD